MSRCGLTEIIKDRCSVGGAPSHSKSWQGDGRATLGQIRGVDYLPFIFWGQCEPLCLRLVLGFLLL